MAGRGAAAGTDQRRATDDLPAIVGLTVGILVVQAVRGRPWPAAFAHGPVEWVWTIAPLRRI